MGRILFEKIQAFGCEFEFQSVQVGTRPGSPACLFCESLCPSQIKPDREEQITEFAFTLHQGNPNPGPDPHHGIPNKPGAITALLDRADPFLRHHFDSQTAFACLVTRDQIIHWSTPTGADMLFPMGSISKLLVNYLIQKAVNESLLNYTDSAADYIDVPMSYKITELMFHRACPASDDFLLGPDTTCLFDQKGFLPILARIIERAGPRTIGREYSNFNHMVLSLLLKELYQKDCGTLLRDLLKALALTSTCFTQSDFQRQIQDSRTSSCRNFLNTPCSPSMGYWTEPTNWAKIC